MNDISKPTETLETPRASMGRRGLFKLGGGLVVAFSLFEPGAAMADNANPTKDGVPPPKGKLYAWLAVHPDDTATLFTGKVEVGNGVQTALAQIAAEELDFPVDKLEVVMGTTSKTVDQGPTYGSRTVRYAGPQIRHAAAAGRQALLDLAARHFNVTADQLTVKDGTISVIGHHETITYGKLVDGKQLNMEIGASGHRFGMKVAPKARLKDPSTYSVVGTSVARKDIPDKVNAAFTFIQDVTVDGMLHGRVVRPYGVKSQLKSVDDSAVKDIPGFVAVVRKKNFLGVVCKTEWGAIKAAEKLGSVLHPKGPDAYPAKWSNWQGLPKQDEIWKVVRQAKGINTTVASSGSVDKAMKSAAKTLKVTYETPYQTHASIGPSCAVADVRKDSATFWSGTQMPHEARRDMAKLLGIPKDRIELIWHESAGAYGRSGLEHVVADAALMSQAVGKPVRVQWMRWDENGWEPKGPAITQDLAGAVDSDGNVVAWRHHMYVPTFLDNELIAAELIGKPKIVGQPGHSPPAIGYAYKFKNADVVSHGEARVGLLTAWLRSPAQFEVTFAMESFIDELAAASGQDPLAFRLKHLEDRRAIDVLQAAAEAYGWQSRPQGPQHSGASKDAGVAKGRGIAWVNRDEARVATIADVEVHRDSGQIRVKRVVVAHDCGLVVNPDGLRNQIEGNVIQSISRTLHEEIAFDRSHVTSRDWKGYPILRFEEVPDRIDTVIVNNLPKYKSLGAGEPSTCPTSAVISNAVFDATGVRLRRTPFRPDRVKAVIG